MYTPQPIAVHLQQNRQNFRRGNCKPYENVVLYDAPNFIMPNIYIKRLTDGGTSATVTVYDLNDTILTTVTPISQDNYPLDDEGEYEMLVLSGGDWVGAISLMSGQKCYFEIDDGSYFYYTDEFTILYDVDSFPPDCDTNWVKVFWEMNGSCVVSGTTTTDPAIPVSAYPKVDLPNFVFWESNLSRPEWEFDEAGENDAHGVFVPDTQRLVKRWTLEGAPVSESVADALTVSALAGSVSIIFKDGTVFTGIRDIKTDISWEQGGCNAIVKYNFSTDYFVKQGCC